MALPASGAISFNDIKTELSYPLVSALSLNDCAVRGLAGVPSGAISMNNLYGKSFKGQVAYTTPGSYTFVAPAGLSSVSVVAVGGTYVSQTTSGRATGGGGLAWRNNVGVTGGASYNIVVGGVTADQNTTVTLGGVQVIGYKGSQCFDSGGSFLGQQGGNGGGRAGGYPLQGVARGGAGGGAGGYTGDGGSGISTNSTPYTGQAGAGGGGGGGLSYGPTIGYGWAGSGGGGVGIFGAGASGPASAYIPAGIGGVLISPAAGGSGGTRGGQGYAYWDTCCFGGDFNVLSYGAGGTYGGGTGGLYCVNGNNRANAPGSSGAVRIVWPGATRQFPSTDVAA